MSTRRHGRLDLSSLDERPLDGGGVASVEVLAGRAGDARLLAFRPTTGDGRRPPALSPALAVAPELEPLECSPADAPRVEFEWDGGTARAQVHVAGDLYGAGLVAAGLLRNGRVVELWNTDAWRYGESTPALYQSHPFVLAVRPDGSALGILGDSVRRGCLALARDGVELAFEGRPFDVYLIEGASPADVQRGLAALVGRAPEPPPWALGYHQCRWSYASADEVLEVARELRARDVPCDALWLDIDHMDRHRPFSWDPERFPDPAGLIDALHGQGLRAVTILDPGLPAQRDYPATRSGLDGGHFVRDADARPARGRVWPGVCHFPDFTSEAARDWWAGLVARHVETGIDGLWIDMNEPALFRTPRGTLPDDTRHAAGAHAEVHNVYGQLMAQATRRGLERARPGRPHFVLTRSNHLAGSRFAATWTGDNQATWEDLGLTIPMVLSLGLCGQPFAGADVGGFDGDPDAELFARWFELGAYLPFFRGHAERSSRRKEPWSFGTETLAHVRAAIVRRMQLLPTLVALFREAARTGMPVVRPLFFADPAAPELRAVDDAFLLGDDLLVAPVVAPGEVQRTVLLPETRGGWYPFPHGGTPLTGTVSVPAPLGTTPVFARSGATIETCAGGPNAERALASPRSLWSRGGRRGP